MAPVIRTYLELTDAARLRPAAPPRVDGEVAIERVDPPDGAVSRFFYTEVGRHHAWIDHLMRSDDDWQAWAGRVQTWVATVDGERAGYYELDPQPDSVEVAYFGLLPAFHGAGLGGHLLTHALTRALNHAPRVWLHTCTLDGPHAQANYEARGLTPYRREEL